MMVKSISPSRHGQFKFKKKKVWIKIDEDDSVEYEAEIIDISDYELHFYDKNGKLILHKKEKHQLDIVV